jgi:serine/threonine protein kinase
MKLAATAKIEHDHIVTIYQVDEDAGVPFLAMKLLVGESLEDRLSREAPLHPAEVIRIGREVAEGLEAAHERGLIHRDIKPANIWLEEGRDRVKIVDFGFARSAVDSEADEAEKNYLIGTPLYMSPEQARGSELDTRTDLFSLGAVLYRASTGSCLFRDVRRGRSSRRLNAKLLHLLDSQPFCAALPVAINHGFAGKIAR